MEVEQVAIIGAGPAGLAAAIQLRRYGIRPLIFERAEMGGLLRNANLVENYPGFPRGISGVKLVKLFVTQAHYLNIEVTPEEVLAVDYEQDYFCSTTHQKRYTSKVLVIATGTKPIRMLEPAIPVEIEGRVFYEVYELLGVSGKRVIIIGSGDAAFDYALNLSKKNQVIILLRGDHPKCLPLLWERAQLVKNIAYENSIRIRQLGEDTLGGITLDCQSPAGEIQYHADYLLYAIGREARLDCLSEKILRQRQDFEGRGVFYMIGDVKNGIYRQASIAVGEGVMAAMKIYRHMKEAG